MKKLLVLFILLFAVVMITIFVTPSMADTYYVATTGDNGDNGSIGSPWETIAYAQAQLSPNDTLYVREGTYESTNYVLGSTGLASGTSGNPITIAGYPGETVTLNSTNPGAGGSIYLNGHSYIIVRNFTLTSSGGPLAVRARNVDHCEFDSLTCTTAVGNNVQFRLYDSSQYNWVHDCEMANQGTGTSSSECIDIGTQQDNTDGGGGTATTDNTSYNLIEDNHFHNGGHHVIGIYGNHNVVRNNHFHGETSYRVIYMNGTDTYNYRNMVEGNIVGYADSAGTMSLDSRHNIVRRNCFYRAGTSGVVHYFADGYLTDQGGISSGAAHYDYLYHNVMWTNGHNTGQTSSVRRGIVYWNGSSTYTMEDNFAKNNILYNNTTTDIGYYHYASAGDNTKAGNWIDSDSDPLFTSTSGSGDYSNSAEYDFNLQSNSPAIDQGVALTTVASANGSGTTLTLDDAGYFSNGWGIAGVDGDEIQLIGTSQTATITAINYTTNVITVDSSLTWTQGQGVSLAYNGSAPDPGANEYSSAESSGEATGGFEPANIGSGVLSTSPSGGGLSVIVQ